MRNVMKKLCLLLCVVCLGFSGTLMVQAKQDLKNEEAKYDLNEGGIQTYTLLDENNQEYYVTIEPVESNLRMTAGTYKITHEVPNAWKGSFYATISSNTFTTVYSPEVYALKGTVLDYYLVKNSTTQATLNIKWRNAVITYSTGFKAWIEDGNLNTKKL